MKYVIDKIVKFFGIITLSALVVSINLNTSYANEGDNTNATSGPSCSLDENILNEQETPVKIVEVTTFKHIDYINPETDAASTPIRDTNNQPETVDNHTPEKKASSKITYSSGTTYYVSTEGDDASSGAETQPWRSIQKAAEMLVAGDTVVVMPGIYNELISPHNSGTKSAPITFYGYGAVVEGSGLGDTPLFTVNSKSYIHIEGFEIQNSGHEGILVTSNNNIESIGITIDNVTVHDIKRSGIMVSGNKQPSFTRITNSTVYRTQLAGIVLWENYGGHFLIEGNEVYDWKGIDNWDGIEVVDTPYTVVRNNTVHDSGGEIPGADYIDVGGDQTLAISHTHHVLVENNLVYKNSGPGALKFNNRPKYTIMRNNRSRNVPIVFYEQPHTHVTVYHNTVIETDSHPLQLWNQDIPDVSFGGIIVKNNIFAFGGKGLQHGPQKVDGSVKAILMDNNLYRPTASWSWANNTSDSDYYRVENSEAEYQRWRKETGQEPDNLGIRTMLSKGEIFTDTANLNFKLVASSPGVNQANALTFAKGFGFGKILTLENSDFFFDGYNGLTQGDLIEVGQQVARILNINEQSHEITIDREIGWNDGDPVYLAGKLGSAPDIGAVESF
jgi:hypothetical protein